MPKIEAGELALPRSSRELVCSSDKWMRHPGLQLDKLSPVCDGDMQNQRKALLAVANCCGDRALLGSLNERRLKYFDEISARRFRMSTQGPLTLHLSRSGCLENAGIALHPIYGFVHLPGSGLKGLARSWAETAWAPKQSDPKAASRKIESIFGRSAGSEGHKYWREGIVDELEGSTAGRIVFHDAWPHDAWPRIALDIVNNHHKDYYAGKDDPGDWEDPIPVYFLAVGAGVSFEFALSDRRSADDGLLDLAQNWLRSALVVEGAGAKTAAGYGRFAPLRKQDARPEEAPLAARYDMKLAAPAFLAGAQQKEADCDLRPATLRGLLRWWWRTMHSAHVDRAGLKRLETAVWGDTKTGSPVRLALSPGTKLRLEQHPRRNDQQFLRNHGIQRPGSGQKVTQGLFYASYGMAEKDNRRWTMSAGAEWELTMTARDGHIDLDASNAKRLSLRASLLLEQAQAALWLFLRFGGAGSRSRKGFGSFNDLSIDGFASIEDCCAAGARFRQSCEIKPTAERELDSPALEDAMVMPEQQTHCTKPWFILNQIGDILQDFAKSLHGTERRWLGLPRSIGRDCTQLSVGRHRRLASPAMFSLTTCPDKTLTVRLIAFPAARRSYHAESKKILGDLVNCARERLTEKIDRAPRSDMRDAGPSGSTHRVSGRSSAAVASSGARPTPEKGTIVKAILLKEFTKKGGWRALHEPTGRAMPIQNTGDVPDTFKYGDQVELYVFSSDAFRWLTEAVKQDLERKRSASGRIRGSNPLKPRGKGKQR